MVKVTDNVNVTAYNDILELTFNIASTLCLDRGPFLYDRDPAQNVRKWFGVEELD